MRIKYYDGSSSIAKNWVGAMKSIRSQWPDAVAWQAGEEISDCDAAGAGRILIWSTEEASVGDDGANAVAVVEQP